MAKPVNRRCRARVRLLEPQHRLGQFPRRARAHLAAAHQTGETEHRAAGARRAPQDAAVQVRRVALRQQRGELVLQGLRQIEVGQRRRRLGAGRGQPLAKQRVARRQIRRGGIRRRAHPLHRRGAKRRRIVRHLPLGAAVDCAGGAAHERAHRLLVPGVQLAGPAEALDDRGTRHRQQRGVGVDARLAEAGDHAAAAEGVARQQREHRDALRLAVEAGAEHCPEGSQRLDALGEPGAGGIHQQHQRLALAGGGAERGGQALRLAAADGAALLRAVEGRHHDRPAVQPRPPAEHRAAGVLGGEAARVEHAGDPLADSQGRHPFRVTHPSAP
jgi:hypothetical protein